MTGDADSGVWWRLQDEIVMARYTYSSYVGNAERRALSNLQ